MKNEVINVLLASHGTSGAMAAENTAFNICRKNYIVTHLIVVPEFWKGILGDDWLNNDCTRNHFCKYLEAELENEVNLSINRIRNKFNSLGVTNKNKILVGKPDKVLVQLCKEESFDVIIMGSLRPKIIKGLKSRMWTSYLTSNINTSLYITPHPYA